MPKNKSSKKQVKKSGGLGAAPKPLPKGQRGGKVQTDFNIEWTRTTVIYYSAIIGIPYLIAIILTIVNGIYVITGVLLFVAALVGVVFAIVRWLDQADL